VNPGRKVRDTRLRIGGGAFGRNALAVVEDWEERVEERAASEEEGIVEDWSEVRGIKWDGA